MKFYLIEVITYNDGTGDTPAVYSYETESEAVSRFHTEMGGWMKKENVNDILCMVINSTGGIHKSEYWKRETATEELNQNVIEQ